MCDSSPIEECFKSLLEKEIASIEDSVQNSRPSATIFPAFSAKLRFLLHNVLQNHPAFRTVSVGVEPDRHPIIFKSQSSDVKIIDTPEGQTFESHLNEFSFRTGDSVITSLDQPRHNFEIFVSTVDKLSMDFRENFPFVVVSRGSKYIEIRRTLKSYYRQGLVNCYEVRLPDDRSDHILLTNCGETRDEIVKSFGDDLRLVSEFDDSGLAQETVNVLHIMSQCDKLLPAKPRNLVDRSAAVNIMSRHLGISKSVKSRRVS